MQVTDLSKRFWPSRRILLRSVLLVMIPLVMLCVGLYLYAAGGRYVTTENAYVKANVIIISPEISGRVTMVGIEDNQPVALDQVLLKLDARPYEIELARTRARMDVIGTELNSLRADYREAEVQTEQANEKVKHFKRRLERQKKLRNQGLGIEEQYDEAYHALQLSKKQVQINQQRVQKVLAALGGDAALPVEQHPRYLAAQSIHEQAAVDLAGTTLRAPASGVVSNMKLQVGEYAQAGKPVFSLIQDDPVWVEANLKETQLTHIHTGQLASVVADAYPDRTWETTVASIAPATGAEFSVLPPQNASGNWVKVVQRVPIRLQIDNNDPLHRLRAGMTVTVRIDTRRERQLSSQMRDVVGDRDVLGMIRGIGQKALAWAGPATN
jgi:membrane fusion protein (multidrug efflux system)